MCTIEQGHPQKRTQPQMELYAHSETVQWHSTDDPVLSFSWTESGFRFRARVHQTLGAYQSHKRLTILSLDQFMKLRFKYIL